MEAEAAAKRLAWAEEAIAEGTTAANAAETERAADGILDAKEDTAGGMSTTFWVGVGVCAIAVAVAGVVLLRRK